MAVNERHWELIQDGYCKRSRYVEYSSGLIVGHVEGKPYDSSEPWYAATDGVEDERISDVHCTENMAIQAVVKAIEKAKMKMTGSNLVMQETPMIFTVPTAGRYCIGNGLRTGVRRVCSGFGENR